MRIHIVLLCLAVVPFTNGTLWAQAPPQAQGSESSPPRDVPAETPPTEPVTAAAADPAPSPLLTVEEAVALALRHNPRLSAAARDITAAEAGVRSARARTNPTAQFTPALTNGGSDEEFLIQQPLELNGTRSARTGVAGAGLRRTRAEATVELRDLVREVRVTYYELARDRELRSVSQEVLRSAEELNRLVSEQVELGARPGIDRVQTGIEVTRAQQQLAQAERQVQISEATLSTLLARGPQDPIGPLAHLTFTPGPVEDSEAVAQRALSERAEITASEAVGESFRQEARLARAEGRPDIAPQFRAGGVTRGVQESGIGVAITLPFLDYGGRRNRIRQAEAAARAQEARTEAARNQVRQEVRQALVRLRGSELIIHNYQGGLLDQARRLLEASRQGFLLGAPGTSLLTVIEAQRTFRNVQTEYTSALADHAQARAELERAAGSVPATLLPADDASQRHRSARRPE